MSKPPSRNKARSTEKDKLKENPHISRAEPEAGSPSSASSSSFAPRHFVVAISGASGALYGVRIVESLLTNPAHHVHLVITSAGSRVLNDELAEPGQASNWRKHFSLSPEQSARLHHYPNNDIGAGPASGTFLTTAMIVCPCSMNTLACIAHGLQPNLLTRAAAVTLKEGRPLLIVPRETPLGLIDLRNMTALAEAGAIILPASPGFYQRPKSIEDLAAFMVQKIMDRLSLEPLNPFRWKGEAE